VSVRRNWGDADWDSERSIRSLGQALVEYRGDEESVLAAIEATIAEAEKRQWYRIFKTVL